MDANMNKAAADNASTVRLNYLHWLLMGGRLEYPQGEDLIGGCGQRRGRETMGVAMCLVTGGVVYTVTSRSNVTLIILNQEIVAKQQFNKYKTDQYSRFSQKLNVMYMFKSITHT